MNGVHRKWAEAMGVDLEKLYCISWFRPSRQSDEYLWRSDVYHQILGLLHMHFGPRGALFDHSRCGSSIVEVPAKKGFLLLGRFHEDSCLSTLSDDEEDVLGRMRQLWLWNSDASDRQPNCRSSRKEAQARYDFESVLQGRQTRRLSEIQDIVLRDKHSNYLSWIRDIMGIPTQTSDRFFDTHLLDQPVEIKIAANYVETRSMSGTMIEHTID